MVSFFAYYLLEDNFDIVGVFIYVAMVGNGGVSELPLLSTRVAFLA